MIFRKTIYSLFFITSIFCTLIYSQYSYSLNGKEPIVGSKQWVDYISTKIVTLPIKIKKERKFPERYKNEVAYYKNQTEGLLNAQPDNSVYWYFNARLINMELSIYYFENKDKKFLERNDYYTDEHRVAQRELMYSSYKKSLDLNAKAEPNNQLTYKMLDNIAFDLGAPYQTRVQALRKILMIPEDQVPEHPDGHVVEDREYLTYKSIVGAYLDGKDFDGALSVLDEMQQKYPRIQNKIEQARSDILSRKARHKEEVAEQEKPSQQTESEELTPVTPTINQSPIVKTETVPQKGTTSQATNDNKTLIIVLALAVLLLIGFVIVKKRKKS